MFNFTSNSATTTTTSSTSPVSSPSLSRTSAPKVRVNPSNTSVPKNEGEKLVREATRNTPYVYFDKSHGILKIVGKSSPESTLGFYEPILTGLGEVKNQIAVDFELIYFNTSSTKCIFSMLKILEDLHKNGTDVTVKWTYEEDDDDMLEVGEDFQDMIDIPLELVEI